MIKKGNFVSFCHSFVILSSLHLFVLTSLTNVRFNICFFIYNSFHNEVAWKHFRNVCSVLYMLVVILFLHSWLKSTDIRFAFFEFVVRIQNVMINLELKH